MNIQIIYVRKAKQRPDFGLESDTKVGWWSACIDHYQTENGERVRNRYDGTVDDSGLHQCRSDAEDRALGKARAMRNVLMTLGYRVIIQSETD